MILINVKIVGTTPLRYLRKKNNPSFRIRSSRIKHCLCLLADMARKFGYKTDASIPFARRIGHNLVFLDQQTPIAVSGEAHDLMLVSTSSLVSEVKTGWGMEMMIVVDEKKLPVKFVRRLFRVAGSHIGLANGVLSKQCPRKYGMFRVVSCKRLPIW